MAPAAYDPEKYAIVRGLIKGMLAGLHEGSPSSRSIVQTSQDGRNPDSGFLQKLIRDGVDFDITGFHYYSQDGHVQRAKDGRSALQILHDQFHKPIWITEFGRQAYNRDAGPSTNPKEQGAALTAALHEIAADASKYDVIGADIYELLDQPDLLTRPEARFDAKKFANFGILDSEGRLTDASMAVQRFLRSYD